MYGPQRSFAYMGLVFSGIHDYTSDQSDLVVLLKTEKDTGTLKPYVYGVTKQAFLPPNVEYDFLKVDIAKNLERRYALPLKFGDIIQWNDDECDHSKKIVYSFYREKPLHRVDSDSRGYLLRVGGVIEPSKPTLFWTQLATIPIPFAEAARAEPNVYLYAWIRVETRMSCSTDPVDIQFSFHKFDECDASDQGRVTEAPWHKLSIESKFTVWAAEPSPIDSDDEIALEPPEGIVKPETKWAEKIRKQLGLYVGERLLICKELPQYDFIIPLLPQVATDESSAICPTIGEYYHFSAVWSNNHRSFIVTDIMTVVMLRSHPVTPNGNLCVRVQYAGNRTRGLFIDYEETLGLMDDPFHCLSFFEFHPINYGQMRASVEVRAVRSTENRSVRYRIVRLIQDDELMSRYLLWIRSNDNMLGPIEGVVINRDTVIAAKHPNVYFRIPSTTPEAERPPIGSGVRFNAKRLAGFHSEATITEFHIFPKMSVKKIVQRQDLRFFQVSLKALPDLEQLAICDDFGPVDTRCTNHPENSGEEYLAWVRESPMRGDCRLAATFMEVYSVATNPPILPTQASSVSSRSSSSRNSYSGSSNGSSSQSSRHSRQSSISITSSRFIGPGSRNLASRRAQQSGSSTSSK
ncbi:unnamed protein product [Caenorhabditis sp. 36 PRJEB53466]|nr:unnamed protein product [Caenorhabditis sp. 36 PRJEB53466]